MAAALFPEPFGGDHRWFSLVHPGPLPRALFARSVSLDSHHAVAAGRRHPLLPVGRAFIRGPSLNQDRTMSTIALQTEGLSKKYSIRHRSPRSGLRHLIEDLLAAPFRGLKRRAAPSMEPQPPPLEPREDFWALRDVSFQVD